MLDLINKLAYADDRRADARSQQQSGFSGAGIRPFNGRQDVPYSDARASAAWSDRSFCLAPGQPNRSEEHTSELQSLMRISYAVFCLKKKKKQTDISIVYHCNTETLLFYHQYIFSTIVQSQIPYTNRRSIHYYYK